MTRSRDVADTQDNLGGAVAPVVSGKNGVINGSFDFWARGTSFSYAGGLQYTADRWCFGSGALGKTISRQTTSDATNLPFIQYCARVQRNSGDTSTADIKLNQSFETVNSIPFVGKTVTFSFYARRGANFSSSSNVLLAYLKQGTGTDQNIDGTYTGVSDVAANGFTLTTTWQRFSVSGTVNTTSTELAVLFSYAPTGTAGTADYFEVTGVQVEVGSVATPFSRAGGSIGGELALCQRYYYRVENDATSSYVAMGTAATTTLAVVGVPLKTTMRVTPTAVDYSSIRLYDTANASIAITSATLQNGSPNTVTVGLGVASGLTQYRPYYLFGNTLPSYIGFTAEL